MRACFACLRDKFTVPASAYFLHNESLYRKWVPVGDDSMSNDAFQVVVPVKVCSLVLKVEHDERRHFGVQKTYLNILKHFLSPKRCVCKY